jgi:hypothetical protein
MVRSRRAHDRYILVPPANDEARLDVCTERFFPGGAKGTRTPDPHTASVVRYQLRHSPKDVPVEVTPRPASLQSRRSRGPARWR